jgi:hypothetical protein
MHSKMIDLITKDRETGIEKINLKVILVTGEPVSILLNLDKGFKDKILLVLLAFGFFIVVDSSILINAL